MLTETPWYPVSLYRGWAYFGWHDDKPCLCCVAIFVCASLCLLARFSSVSSVTSFHLVRARFCVDGRGVVKLKPASFCLRHASRPAGFTARPPRASGSHAPRAPGDPHHLCPAARHPGADHPRPAGTAATSTQQSVSCVPALPHTPLFNGRGEQVSRHPPPNSLSPVFQPSAPLPPTSSGGGVGGGTGQ